jgi:methionine-rich copper-binding protein CopC/putative copper export protein
VRYRNHCLLLLISALSLGILLVFNWMPPLSQAPVAFAHAFVIGSDPIDGSTINAAPPVVRIYFNEAIGPASIAHVFAPDGRIVDAARSSIPRTNLRELDTPLTTPGALPQGGYTVRWTALSDADGHTTHGVIGFNIGHSSFGLPGQVILGPSTSNIMPQLDTFGVLMIAWDWLVMLALTFWVGILAMEWLVISRAAGNRTRTQQPAAIQNVGAGLAPALSGPALHDPTWEASNAPALPDQIARQSVPLQWLCLAALLVGEVITLVLRATFLTQGLGGGGIDLGVLGQLILATSYGHLWLVRVACIAAALGLLWWTTREHSTTTPGATPPKSRFGRLRQQVAPESDARPPIAAGNVGVGFAPALSDSALHDPAREAGNAPVLHASSIPAAPRSADLPYWYRGVGLVLAGIILLTMAVSGDEAQLAQPHASAVVLDWLYLVAQSLLFGGFAYLGYILIPLLLAGKPERRTGILVSLLQGLAAPALVTFGVLLVSGLFLSESSLTSVQQLFSNPYGRTMLIQLILIALVLALSINVLFVIRPRLARRSSQEQGERRLRQSLRIQSWVAGGALLCASLMAFYAPPIVFPAVAYTAPASPNQATPSTTSLNAQTQRVGNFTVTLQVLPGRVDYANTVIVTINDSSGNPVTDAQVQLRTNMELMNMGTAQATVKGGNPTYIAAFNKDAAFSMFGVWDIAVRIQRPNQAPVQAVFKVTLEG